MFRDLSAGKTPEINIILDRIADADADIIVLQGVDWDHGGLVVHALQAQLSDRGRDYPHTFAPRPNSGVQTGFDIDQNNRTNEGRDAQGYGRFAGEGADVLLSRYPILTAEIREFSDLLWRDIQGSRSNDNAELAAIQRLSSVAHYAVPIRVGDRVITVLSAHPTPPVFDGPEDRNGRRNADENAFFIQLLDGAYGAVPVMPIIAGNLNLDPQNGEGLHWVMRSLLADQRLQNPPVLQHSTAAFSFGELRLSYILPSADLQVLGGGMAAPTPDASRHRLIWLDLQIP